MKNILLFSALALIFSCSNQKESTLHEDVKFLEKVCAEYSDARHDYSMSSGNEYIYTDTSNRVNAEILRRSKIRRENSIKQIRLLYPKLKEAREKIKNADFSILDNHELFIISYADELASDTFPLLK